MDILWDKQKRKISYCLPGCQFSISIDFFWNKPFVDPNNITTTRKTTTKQQQKKEEKTFTTTTSEGRTPYKEIPPLNSTRVNNGIIKQQQQQQWCEYKNSEEIKLSKATNFNATLVSQKHSLSNDLKCDLIGRHERKKVKSRRENKINNTKTQPTTRTYLPTYYKETSSDYWLLLHCIVFNLFSCVLIYWVECKN